MQIDATHVVIRDSFAGCSDTVIPAGTRVELLTSRKEDNGEWSCLVKGTRLLPGKTYGFSIPFSSLEKIKTLDRRQHRWTAK